MLLAAAIWEGDNVAIACILSASLVFSGEGSTTGEDAIPYTELSNQRLHCLLTRAAWHRLKALTARWSVAFGGGEQPTRQDLEPPDGDEPGTGSSRPGAAVAVMAGVQEDAFSSRRCAALPLDPLSMPARKCSCPLQIKENHMGLMYRFHAWLMHLLEAKPDRRKNPFFRSRQSQQPDAAAGARDKGYYVPVAGGLLDPDEEADVPGGAPVIIEDFFKGCLGEGAPEGSSSHRTSEDTGVWCA